MLRSSAIFCRSWRRIECAGNDFLPKFLLSWWNLGSDSDVNYYEWKHEYCEDESKDAPGLQFMNFLDYITIQWWLWSCICIPLALARRIYHGLHSDRTAERAAISHTRTSRTQSYFPTHFYRMNRENFTGSTTSLVSMFIHLPIFAHKHFLVVKSERKLFKLTGMIMRQTE